MLTQTCTTCTREEKVNGNYKFAAFGLYRNGPNFDLGGYTVIVCLRLKNKIK